MVKIRLITISAFLLLLLFLAACGTSSQSASNVEEKSTDEQVDAAVDGDSDEEQSSELGDFAVELGGEVLEEDGKFIIEGTSNLIPGSRLVGEVVVSGDEVFADTTELVQDDGSFYMELDHHEYGEAEIVVRFDFNNVQDDPIIRHYGERGQNLEGPFVYSTNM